MTSNDPWRVEEISFNLLSATSSPQHEVPGVTTSDLGKDKNDEEKRRWYWELGGIDEIEAKDYATATTTIYTSVQALDPEPYALYIL